jgi:hypothetical protein
MKSGLAELTAVLTVAQQRNFRAAAGDLGMSRSALSHAVSTFEQRIGVRLFHRTTRSVSLTQAGEQFVASVSPALRQIDDALALQLAAKLRRQARCGFTLPLQPHFSYGPSLRNIRGGIRPFTSMWQPTVGSSTSCAKDSMPASGSPKACRKT